MDNRRLMTWGDLGKVAVVSALVTHFGNAVGEQLHLPHLLTLAVLVAVGLKFGIKYAEANFISQADFDAREKAKKEAA